MSQDALSLVRQATITRTPVNYELNHYIFGQYKFHEGTKTCFKRTLNSAVDYYYTLRDVIFYLENADATVAEYRRKVVTMRCTAVVEHDKASLKDYLTGVIDSCPQLDFAAAVASAASYNTNAAIESEATAPSVPLISAKEMQEQRQRHAAIFDQSIQMPTQSRSAEVAGLSHDKLAELRLLRRTQKRKSVITDGGLEGMDATFIQMDRKYLENLRADEEPANTRATVLCKAGSDFSFALKLFNEHILRPESQRAKAAAATTGSTNQSDPSQNKKSRLIESSQPGKPSNGGTKVISGKDCRPPIIIVPSALSGIISSMNAVDFLENNSYVTIEEKRKNGGQREKERQITRNLPGGVKAKYLLVDNANLNPKDWDRVVAVFAMGQAWQFKDWPEGYTNPVDLFNKVDINCTCV
jgi:parafibromin